MDADARVAPGVRVEPDGRRARRDRGRAAVIEALLELVLERGTTPGTDDLVERSGVSLSSIFRYFENLDDLQHQTIDTHFERHASLFAVPAVGEGSLDNRTKRFVDARLELYEVTAPIARLARSRAHELPVIAATLHRTREVFAEQVTTHFGSEVSSRSPAAASDLVDLITTMTSFEAWDLLVDGDRPRRQIRRAWLTGLRSLLASPV